MAKNIRTILKEQLFCDHYNEVQIDQALSDIKTALEGEAVRIFGNQTTEKENEYRWFEAIPLESLDKLIGKRG